MKMQKMRFDNDCTVASVSMVTRIPYDRCLKVAIENGFIPDGKIGFDVAVLLMHLDIECCYGVNKLVLCKDEPIITSIHSLNNPDGFHAVAVHQGKVYDPSNKKTASLNYVLDNYKITYYNFRPDE